MQTQPLLFMSVTRRGGLRGAAEIHEALAEAADLGVAVVVLGGEPLARPELVDVAGRFPELMFIFVTDGSLLDDAALVKLERYRNIIPVLSLDPVEAVTDEWRGHGGLRPRDRHDGRDEGPPPGLRRVHHDNPGQLPPHHEPGVRT